jgi:hypothetical protein
MVSLMVPPMPVVRLTLEVADQGAVERLRAFGRAVEKASAAEKKRKRMPRRTRRRGRS